MIDTNTLKASLKTAVFVLYMVGFVWTERLDAVINQRGLLLQELWIRGRERIVTEHIR